MGRGLYLWESEVRAIYSFINRSRKEGEDTARFLGAPLRALAFSFFELHEKWEVMGTADYVREHFILLAKTHDDRWRETAFEEDKIRRYLEGNVPFHEHEKPFWKWHTKERIFLAAMGVEKSRITETRGEDAITQAMKVFAKK
jgi:hypothetical protein